MIVGPLGRFYDQVGNRMTLCEAHKTQIENGQGYTKVDSVELKEVL